MAPRLTPTIRQRRFGAELRRLREAAGMSASAAASLLGTDRTAICNIEAGHFGISEEYLRPLANIYKCGDNTLIDALAQMTGGRMSGCWDEYRGKIPPGFLDVSEMEHDTVGLRTVQTTHVPGLFQTEDHARAILELDVPPLKRLELELRMAHRLARQVVVTGVNPIPYICIIHEAALRMQLGDPKVARSQPAHLLEVGVQDRVPDHREATGRERDHEKGYVVPACSRHQPSLGYGARGLTD